jgi:heme/copper-type cytochrome/quinol oxidase subunit 3
MNQRIVRDVSSLPTYGYSTDSTPWWGSLGFIAIEGMGFALAIALYLYLYAANSTWLQHLPPLTLWPGTVLTALLLASVIPNMWADRVARQEDLGKVRIALIVMSLIGVAALPLRAYEFMLLPVKWDISAYGSALWFILGLHTTHLATDLGDTIVLALLMFTRHAAPRRFSDVTANAFYWNFVVLAWLPVYLLLYWTPRL